MAGRRPVPDAIKDLTGSHNARNPRSPRVYVYRSFESIVVLKDVEREPRALELWNEITPELVAAGLLTRGNLTVWGNYCLAYASACHAQDDVFDNGRWVEHDVFDKKGNVVYAYVGETLTDRPSLKAILAQLDKLQPKPLVVPPPATKKS